jgi:hypothetical protein
VTSEANPRDGLGGHYEVLQLLGTGGAATVHRARDARTGRTVALKRLRPAEGTDRGRLEELFRQEFHTLAHLSHPNIVAAYDYGVDEAGAYYTMELLDGGDLQERVPLEWRAACAVARDVCSALSIVHSRRLVFRDLSPRNIRCTADGKAKLLDFGALAPFGRTRLFVGTPAFAAPEAASLQTVDARTDLYSLGATLYFAITGRRPYAVASVPQLLASLQSTPTPPGQLIQGLPPELDALLVDMMQVDPTLRPASAAEVMERLGAIAGLDRTEHLLVSRAYLATPTLVGRDASIERFRRWLGLARQGIGSAVIVQGPRGAGRSRFLDACVLEAKLAGATALRAEAADSLSGDYGAARTLAAQLLDASPDEARKAAEPARAVLSAIAAALRAEGEAPPAEQPAHTVLQPALREWFVRVARSRPLVIAIDDVHEVDLASASLIALLAREVASSPLVIVASRPTDATIEPSKALELLEASSRAVRVGPLSAARTETLVRSSFGDVPNVEAIAARIHAVSGGLPRNVMHLAQHLVDAKIARYDAGAWVLPRSLGESDLPADMTAARRARVDARTADARALAQAFALAPDGIYSFDECVLLAGAEDGGRLIGALDELVQAEMVVTASSDFAVEKGFREALSGSVEAAVAPVLHARIARVLERRGDEEIRLARHLFAAGQEARGLDVLVGFSERSIELTGNNMVAFTRLFQSLPEGWLDIFDRAIALCLTLPGRRRKDPISLLIRVTGILSQLPIDAGKYFEPLFAQLRRDTGLDLWEAAADVADGGARLKGALGGAAARHAQGEAGGTVFDPKTAIGHLGRAVAAAAGVVSSCLAVDLVSLLPPLGPFAPLAPALSSWQALIDGLGARITGRTDLARSLYERQLARLAAPDRAGLDETYQRTQQLGIALVLGTIEAPMGLAATLERARVLEASPLHDVNAKRIRMLYHLWQGNLTEAERLRNEAEVLTVERARRQTNEGAHLPRELQAHALAEDLTRVKRTVASIEQLARSARGWVPVLHRAHAAYELIRGSVDRALAEIEASLAAMDPAGHPIWPDAAAAHVTTLLAAGRSVEARDTGEAYVAEATRRELGYETSYIRMPLAVAHARLGAAADATRHCDLVDEAFRALGTRGMNLGLACEARARVALELGDRDGFARHAATLAGHFRGTTSPALEAKYQRLMRAAQRKDAARDPAAAANAEGREVDTVVEALGSCKTQDEKLARALALLLQRSGASKGVLLTADDGQLVEAARVGIEEVPPEALARAQALWDEQCRLANATAMGTAPPHADSVLQETENASFQTVLLSHEVDGGLALTGVVLAATAPGETFRHPARMAVAVSRVVMGDRSAVLLES